MKVYDNYEISGCAKSSEYPYEIEQVDDSEAQFWTLFGHVEGEGVEAIGDFPSRESAEQVYSRITGQPFTGSYQADTRLRVMHAGPRLLEALITCANLLADYDESDGDEGEAWREAIAVIQEATDGSPSETRKPIVIEVRGGVVQDVHNVPPGYQYEIKDYDNLEAESSDGGRAA